MEERSRTKTKRSAPDVPDTATASSSPPSEQNQSGNGLSLGYFQMQLLLECLLRVPYDASAHDELIAMCYEQFNSNHNELRMLRELKDRYSPSRALWWYAQECFLYKILNNSLESQDIRNLFLLRGILRDVEQQIRQHRCSTPLHLYRSQLMPTELLDRWISSVGQCVAVNSFLSATTSHEVAMTFLNASQEGRSKHERVLLEIDADPRVLGSKPFVQLGVLDFSNDKHEVLFMFGSIFMINNITCGNDGLYTVELTLYSDTDHELTPIFDDMKAKYASKPMNLLTFTRVLYDLDRFDEAEEYVRLHLEQLPADHEEAVQCYILLGLVAAARIEFDTSLTWYHKALELCMRRSPRSDDPKIAEIHESIGDLYWKQGSQRVRN